MKIALDCDNRFILPNRRQPNKLTPCNLYSSISHCGAILMHMRNYLRCRWLDHTVARLGAPLQLSSSVTNQARKIMSQTNLDGHLSGAVISPGRPKRGDQLVSVQLLAPAPVTITLRVASTNYGVSRATLYRWHATGRLKFLKAGRRTLLLVSELKGLIGI